MDPGLLPRLHIMYAQCPSDSGKVHSDVKKRWLNGDKEVQGAMEELAGIVDAGRCSGSLPRGYLMLSIADKCHRTK